MVTAVVAGPPGGRGAPSVVAATPPAHRWWYAVRGRAVAAAQLILNTKLRTVQTGSGCGFHFHVSFTC